MLRLGKGSRLGLLYVAFVEDGLCQLDEGRFDVDVGLEIQVTISSESLYYSPWQRFPKI